MINLRSTDPSEKRLVTLPIHLIKPSPTQPRTDYDEYELLSLADSIRKNGLLQPVSVRRLKNGEYELIAGQRRLYAMQLLGMGTAPCIVTKADELTAAVFSLIENLQRKDLGPFEEAEGIHHLMESFGMTAGDAAEYLGMAPSTLSNKLRILRLHPSQRMRIAASGLCERHARALLRLPEEKRDTTLDIIIARQLTVAETDRLIDSILAPPPEPPTAPRCTAVVTDLRIFTNSFLRMIDTMRKSGVNAKTAKTETDEFVEYTVRIKKPLAREGATSDR